MRGRNASVPPSFWPSVLPSLRAAGPRRRSSLPFTATLNRGEGVTADDRIRFITHNNCDILFFDLSGPLERDEALDLISRGQETVADTGRDDLLTLTDVSDTEYDMEIGKALLQLVRHNKAFVRAAAIVGVSGMQRNLLELIQTMSRRRFATFGNTDDAKDWLTSSPES